MALSEISGGAKTPLASRAGKVIPDAIKQVKEFNNSSNRFIRLVNVKLEEMGPERQGASVPEAVPRDAGLPHKCKPPRPTLSPEAGARVSNESAADYA